MFNRRRSVLSPVLLACALGVAGPVPAAAAPTATRGQLLPVPAGGPHRQISVRAVDVSPAGVVAGNVQETTTAPDGSTSSTQRPQRWTHTGRDGWTRRPLALPPGAGAGSVAGLTDQGEAGGSVTRPDGARATRWSADGRSTTELAGAPSAVTAVGPDGPWAVATYDAAIPVVGEAELVSRDGVRTALRGTSDLDTGYRRTVSSAGGPDTAVVWVTEGLGQGVTTRPVLWRAGGTVPLAVVGSALLGPACVARVRPGGSTVYSGYQSTGGTLAWVLVRHSGGVPGTDVTLSRATAAGQPTAGLVGTPGTDPAVLAADGGIAGYVTDADGRRAAFWNAADERTVVPLAAGERSASGVAAAGGGRMVILAEHTDGTRGLSLWDDGVRTPLSTPRGWDVDAVVELTDAGLLVANLRDAAGVVRPAAWHLP